MEAEARSDHINMLVAIQQYMKKRRSILLRPDILSLPCR